MSKRLRVLHFLQEAGVRLDEMSRSPNFSEDMRAELRRLVLQIADEAAVLEVELAAERQASETPLRTLGA